MIENLPQEQLVTRYAVLRRHRSLADPETFALAQEINYRRIMRVLKPVMDGDTRISDAHRSAIMRVLYGGAA